MSGLKAKLRKLAAKAIKHLAPMLADAVAKEVRRRISAPPKESSPLGKTGQIK